MTSFWEGLGRVKQNVTNGNNLKKFFDDKEKITTQFKALYKYGGTVSDEERKQFHLKNYRRAFSFCRNALDEYAKRVNAKQRGDKDDVTRPCQVIEALTRLCEDIPHLVKQNWNQNAFSELLTKFLNFNTNEEIRLKGVELACILINAGKDTSYHRYIECLSFAADFTPYCIEKPYENHYNNFKKNLILGMFHLFLQCKLNKIRIMCFMQIATEALPWIRT